MRNLDGADFNCIGKDMNYVVKNLFFLNFQHKPFQNITNEVLSDSDCSCVRNNQILLVTLKS